MDEKLEKKNRHQIYKNVLLLHKQWVHKDIGRVLCPMLGCKAYDAKENEIMYPEFFLFKPEHIKGYAAWFSKSGRNDAEYATKAVKEHQRTVLEFCIEMTK